MDFPHSHPVPHTSHKPGDVQQKRDRCYYSTLNGATSEFSKQKRSRSTSSLIPSPYATPHNTCSPDDGQSKHRNAWKSVPNDAKCEHLKRKRGSIGKRTLEQIRGRWKIVWRQSDEDFRTRSQNALRVEGKRTLDGVRRLDLYAKRGSSRYAIGFDCSFRSYIRCFWLASGCWFPCSHKYWTTVYCRCQTMPVTLT